MRKYDFYRGRYLPSNGTIVIGVLPDLDLHFQGQTFCCYAFKKKKIAQVSDIPADVPRLVWTRCGVALVSFLVAAASAAPLGMDVDE